MDYRKYLISKVHRSCCAMSSPDFKTRMLCAMFAGRPMHWLWLRLKWLDEHAGGLLDARHPIALIDPIDRDPRSWDRRSFDAPSSDLRCLWGNGGGGGGARSRYPSCRFHSQFPPLLTMAAHRIL